jgi:hypothetical protein
MELYIKLIQFAKKSDHKDIRQLYKAVFGEGLYGLFRQTEENKGLKIHETDRENELLDRLLAELSHENLAHKIGFPMDEARLSYLTDKVTVKDGHEFDETVTAFYAHIYRYLESPTGHLSRSALSTKAIEVVEEAFEHKGGYTAALAEAKYGVNGGVRLVFDTMTEHLKKEKKGKYILMIFKVMVDSLDWDLKMRLMKVFLDRIRPVLPADLKDIPADQVAKHWEEIIRCYADSLDKVSDLLKRL